MTENKMGVMPVGKLLVQMSLPLVASLLVSSAYNLVDSVYISRMGEAALSAVSLSAPIQTLTAALGSGTAVGLNAVLSKALGEKNQDEVRRCISSSLFIALVSYIVILIAGIFTVRPYFLAQTSDPEIIENGVAYLRTVMVLSMGTMFQWVLERLLVSTGKTHLFMITLTSGSIVNLILDPVFIFGWFGIPAMGAMGAGIATVFGQWTSASLAFILNRKCNREIPMRFDFRPYPKTIKNILATGIPTAMISGFTSLAAVAVNQILLAFSSTAVAVYGAILRVINMVNVLPHGFGLGIVPIVAYNLGAGKRERITKAIRCGLLYGGVLALIGTLALQIFPGPVMGLFDPSPEMLAMGVPALRILSLILIFGAVNAILSSAFQGLGKGVYSMYVSLMRQVALTIPLAWAFSLTGSLTAVWFAFPAAEGLTILLSLALYRRTRRMALPREGAEPVMG